MAVLTELHQLIVKFEVFQMVLQFTFFLKSNNIFNSVIAKSHQLFSDNYTIPTSFKEILRVVIS